MNKPQAEKTLSEVKPKYALIGFKSDGYRGIPPTYEMKFAVATDINLFESMIGMEGVRVFALSEVEDDWLKKRNEYMAKKVVDEEKEMLDKLKKKYEPNV